MDLKELGVLFKKEREKRGLTVKEVTELTKISRRNIIALEEGIREDLPHPVYAKGFIKNYARVLGLDAADLARIIDVEFPPDEDSGEGGTAVQTRGGQKRPHPGEAPVILEKTRWPALALVTLLIVMLGALVWYVNRVSRYPAAKPQPAQEAVASVAPPAQPVAAPAAASAAAKDEQARPEALGPAAQPAAGQAAFAQPTGPAEPAAQPAQPVAPEPQKPALPAPQAAAQKPAAEPQKPASMPALAEGQHLVTVTARDNNDCWIQVLAVNGRERTSDFILKRGTSHSFRFEKSIRLKFGNIAGVGINADGRPHSVDMQLGNVQTLTFTAR